MTYEVPTGLSRISAAGSGYARFWAAARARNREVVMRAVERMVANESVRVNWRGELKRRSEGSENERDI